MCLYIYIYKQYVYIYILNYVLLNMFDYIMSKPLGLHKMRMGWIRNNAVDKKNSNRENI